MNHTSLKLLTFLFVSSLTFSAWAEENKEEKKEQKAESAEEVGTPAPPAKTEKTKLSPKPKKKKKSIIDTDPQLRKLRKSCIEGGKDFEFEANLYPNGKKWNAICRKDGDLEGPKTSWYSNGRKMREGQYRDNELHGVWRHWHRNGKKADEGSWKNSVPIGKWAFYHENGKVRAQGEFKQGKRQGPWEFFNSSGRKVAFGRFDCGNKIDAWQEYDPNTKKMSPVNYEGSTGCRGGSEWLSFQMEAFRASQGSQNEIYSFLFGLSPKITFGRRWDGRLSLMFGLGRNREPEEFENDLFAILDYQFLVHYSFTDTRQFSLGLGGGGQSWIEYETFPVGSFRAEYRPHFPFLDLVDRFYVQYAAGFHSYKVVNQVKLGFGFYY